eukprot:Colp12_sorted_trinity150504_noHs@7563
MAGKHLINDPSTAVDESIDGLVASFSTLKRLQGTRVVFRHDVDDIKDAHVTLISGGGSGHEPSHAGFVGKGMLTAAVAGSVFASPPPTAILAAIRRVSGKAGTLLIVKNYTGDRLNFGVAAERAKAEGYKVEMVIVGDDCALLGEGRTAGRRGLCGTILVHKIMGAMAQNGASLSEMLQTAEKVTASLGTVGVCLSPCVVPGSHAGFQLGEKEMELGLGIHGEAGVARLPLDTVDSVVKSVLDLVAVEKRNGPGPVYAKGDSVVLVVNNLGGTSNLELPIVALAAHKYLANKGISVARCYVGAFMTSLSMGGVSLTLLTATPELISLLDAPSETPAFPHSGLFGVASNTPTTLPAQTGDGGVSCKTSAGNLIKTAITNAAAAVTEAEPKLTELDSVAGDGDCGTTLRDGFQRLVRVLNDSKAAQEFGLPSTFVWDLDGAAGAFRGAGEVLETMGGSSGAIYSMLFSVLAREVTGKDPMSLQAWGEALETACLSISKYGGAQRNDRTMLDALYPLADYLKAATVLDAPALDKAAESSKAGAEATAHMRSHAGRSSYVNPALIEGQPDAGAMGVSVWVRALCDTVKTAL